MTEIRKADPGTRRRTLLLVLATTLAGALSIDAIERYSGSLQEWLLSEPEQLTHRVGLLFFAVGSALSVPLLAFALYLWSFGAKVMAAREFPPPGQGVARDTPVRRGAPALRRGRLVKGLALCLALAVVGWWLLLGFLAQLVAERFA